MNNNTSFSISVPVFHGRELPEKGSIVGYGAIVDKMELSVPIPATLALISKKNKKYDQAGWRIFTPKHQPKESLYKQLIFALKYEGVDLLVFKKLFEKLSTLEILALLQIEPTGQYSRKIWFLYEWLMNEKLDIPDLKIKQAIPLLDEKLQYGIKGISSPRHRIINNLPGTREYCPLIKKTEKLENYVSSNIAAKKSIYLKGIRKDVLQRTSSFLLLKDSKASFNIEGENPGNNRAMRWGRAIGQAGRKPLSTEELNRLQQIVIENNRFLEMGYRKKGGFVGDRDRTTLEPIPDHISAKPGDLEQLLEGLISTNNILQEDTYDAVLVAATIAFGFVFIHPFVDGNGRLHRYIIHHILSKNEFTQQGDIFPVSASILDHISTYNTVLEAYSHPLLDHIHWQETADHNVEVTSETIDFYRYFDVTKQAEFLYDCVDDTLARVIPEEVKYFQQFDQYKRYLDNNFEMPDNMVSMLVRFLEQNEGVLSKRALKKEFSGLRKDEVMDIEENYKDIFLGE